jgi:cobalt/nickel transport system permease protein
VEGNRAWHATLQVVHIPDGYLSPSTCAALFAGATPFWFVALRRLKRALHTRLVPRLSLFAAFSFVVMMFNIPLPGGTTGHAVGVALAAIVLGPSASILAVSTALVIQAFFFGDGGITALGANCFNIAIAGSLSAFPIYRALAGRARLESPRRVVAAGLAGYAAINVAALLAAIEFGVQPLWFRDAAGAPLYCPYPLGIAVPAMMIGHLTVAGAAELALTGGVVAFLQRTDASLLAATAGSGVRWDAAAAAPDGPGRLGPLWVALGLLLLLTPLGVLAGGTAWGEWQASAFGEPAARQAMAAASRGHLAPTATPAGLARWATVWTAPVPAYAPAFLRSQAAGYALSAMFGAGLVVLAVTAIGRAMGTRHRGHFPQRRGGRLAWGARTSRGFVERTVDGLLHAMERAVSAEAGAARPGLLQRLDPRVKLAGLLALVAAVALSHRADVIAALLCAGIALAAASRVRVGTLISGAWMTAMGFSCALAVPALFLTPGRVVATMPVVGWAVTAQGLASASYLVLRAAAASTFGLLLVFTTRWSHVLKALRAFRVPVVFVVILATTYRYVLLLLESAHDMYVARRSRTVGQLPAAERRRIVSRSAGVLLTKSLHLGNDVFLAMQARGFRGEVFLLDDFRMARADWLALGVLAAVASAAVWAGR